MFGRHFGFWKFGKKNVGSILYLMYVQIISNRKSILYVSNISISFFSIRGKSAMLFSNKNLKTNKRTTGIVYIFIACHTGLFVVLKSIVH